MGARRCARGFKGVWNSQAQGPMFQHCIQGVSSEKSWVEHEVASVKAVPNLGERHCDMFCEGAESSMMMYFQVADIHRPLLSLSRAADQGFQSYLDWYGGCLEDTQTGEQIPTLQRGNFYVKQIWVRCSFDKPHDSSGFFRRG